MPEEDKLAVFVACYLSANDSSKRLKILKHYSDVLKIYGDLNTAIEEGKKVLRERGWEQW